MASGSNTITTSDDLPNPDEVVSETADGVPMCRGDSLFWYETYRDMWNGGVLHEVENGLDDPNFGCFQISGSGWSLEELSWAVAEGRVKQNHLFVLNRDDFLKSHEIDYL